MTDRDGRSLAGAATLGGMVPAPSLLTPGRETSLVRCRRPSAARDPRPVAHHPVVAQRAVGGVGVAAGDRDRRARGVVGEPGRVRARVPPDGAHARGARVAHARGRAPAAVRQPARQRRRRALAARLPELHVDRRLPPGAHGAPPPGVRARRTRHPARTRAIRSPRASFRRKLVRDATGRTGIKLFRQQAAGFRSPDARVRHTLWKILLVQAVLLAAAIVGGVWWVYPVFWVLPYLTVWRVINRLRSIAEHGGMDASADRRATTHSVRQSWWSRTFLVPFHIGWHLAHHVDAGVSMRHLPEYHRALHRVRLRHARPRVPELPRALARPARPRTACREPGRRDVEYVSSGRGAVVPEHTRSRDHRARGPHGRGVARDRTR